METGKVIMLVGAEAPVGREKEWNKWCDEIHFPDIMKFPGVESATRYIRVMENEGKYPQYLALFEFSGLKEAKGYDISPERKVALEERDRKWGKGGAGGVLSWRVHYKTIKNWQK